MGTIGTRITAAALSLATVVLSLAIALVATPADAAWSNASGITRFHLCRMATPSGKGWVFHARATKRAGTEDARAGMALREGRRRTGQRWSSGWLDTGEVAWGSVHIRRSRRVTLHVWQEAGDRDSPIGTAIEAASYQPRQIKHC